MKRSTIRRRSQLVLVAGGIKRGTVEQGQVVAEGIRRNLIGGIRRAKKVLRPGRISNSSSGLAAFPHLTDFLEESGLRSNNQGETLAWSGGGSSEQRWDEGKVESGITA